MNESELHARMHDAYESMGPSDESYARVLASLKGAQGQRTQARKRPRIWWVLAPLAACVAVLAVVIGQNAANKASVPATDAAPLSSEQTTGAATETYAEESSKRVGEANAAEQESAPLAMTVVLEDGTTYEIGEALATEPSWSNLEDAVATNEETGEKRPCVVADGSYLRFEGETTWYHLRKTD